MSNRDDTNDKRSRTYADPPVAGTPVSIRFEEISKGETEVLIVYRDQHYRLRATKNGKLILNK